MSRRPRGLHPDERELWHRVAATARALHPDHPQRPDRSEKQPPQKAKPQPKPLFKPFQLGDALRPQPRLHDLAPSLEQHLTTALLRMDRNIFGKMSRGKVQPEARIDLHGMTLAEAHPELIRFILGAHAGGKRLVLVITGKGKRGVDHGPIPQRMGALRHQVPQWLAQPPLGALILQVASASLKHGGAGAYYVYLKRQR